MKQELLSVIDYIMDKHLFLVLILMAIALSNCTLNDDSAITNPTRLPSDISGESPTDILVRNTPTPVDMATPTLLQPEDEMATSTSISAPTLANNEHSPRVCTSPPQQFNIREVLEMSILDLRFENEDLVTFEGWTEGPEPIVIPVTPEATPDVFPGPHIYTRRLLTGGQISLPDSQLSPRPLVIEPILNNPCREDCPLEVISQSPNREWQLVQVHDWLVEVSGIWLVGRTEMVRLIPYITHLKWQWSADSSLLWIVYSDPELGGYTLVVELGSPVITRGTGPIAEELPSVLNPWYYIVAFSPVDKVALSTTSFEFTELDNDGLFTIRLTDPLTLTGSTRVIPGIVTVNWNDATQSFLLEIVKESGIEIQDLSGNTLLVIPRSTLELFHSIPDEGPLEPYFRIGNDFALSPSGEKFIIVQGPNLLLFECGHVTMP